MSIHYHKKTASSGFTLLELLVVISLLLFLLSVVMPAMEDARNKARYSRAVKELQEMTRAVIVAQGETGLPLSQITGSGCSRCQCADVTDLKNISEGSSCYTRWETSLNAIITASDGLGGGLEDLDRDPWGTPYLLDENEGEQVGNPCRADLLRTAGPDGIRDTADDYLVNLPFRLPQCN